MEGGPRRAAVVAVPGARGELCSGREEEGRGLGKVEEGVGVLTVGGIEPGRLEWGDRREGSVLGQEQSK